MVWPYIYIYIAYKFKLRKYYTDIKYLWYLIRLMVLEGTLLKPVPGKFYMMLVLTVVTWAHNEHGS